MRKILFFILIQPFFLTAQSGLINSEFIQEYLTREAHWCGLHGAYGQDLGTAMLYYGLVYSAKAKTCVCLGSGDGFVPRVMRQAQKDLKLEDAKTILIDGNMGNSGRPVWLSQNSFLRKKYPEIEIIIDSSARVAQSQAKEWHIDYLHIDADRTVQGSLQDFLDYLPYMAKNGIITLHDAGAGRPCAHTAQLIKNMGYSLVIFETFGTGIALIVLDKKAKC